MPECLGTMKEFRKKYAIPISKARDLDATDKEVPAGRAAHVRAWTHTATAPLTAHGHTKSRIWSAVARSCARLERARRR